MKKVIKFFLNNKSINLFANKDEDGRKATATKESANKF